MKKNQHTRVIGSYPMMTGEARKKQKKVKGEDLFIHCSVNLSGVTVGHNSISGHTQNLLASRSNLESLNHLI